MPCDTTANKISASAVKQPEVKRGYQSLLNNQELYHQLTSGVFHSYFQSCKSHTPTMVYM